MLSEDIEQETLKRAIVFLNESMDKNANEVDISLMTFGGSTDGSAGIYDAVIYARSKGLVVNIIGFGTIQSAGVFLLQAATNRILAPNCNLFLHPTMPGKDLSEDKRDYKHVLASLAHVQANDERYAEVIANRSGIDIEEIQRLRRANGGYGSYLTADKAIEP